MHDNSCLFVARSQISVSSIITLLANHMNLASHTASHNSDLIGAGSTCKTKKQRLEVKQLPLSLAPVPQNTFPRTSKYIIQRPCSNKEHITFRFGDAISLEQLNIYTVFLRTVVRNGGIEIDVTKVNI